MTVLLTELEGEVLGSLTVATAESERLTAAHPGVTATAHSPAEERLKKIRYIKCRQKKTRGN